MPPYTTDNEGNWEIWHFLLKTKCISVSRRAILRKIWGNSMSHGIKIGIRLAVQDNRAEMVIEISQGWLEPILGLPPHVPGGLEGQASPYTGPVDSP